MEEASEDANPLTILCALLIPNIVEVVCRAVALADIEFITVE